MKSVDKELFEFYQNSIREAYEAGAAGDDSFYPIDAEAMIMAAREEGISARGKVGDAFRKMVSAFNDAYERGEDAQPPSLQNSTPTVPLPEQNTPTDTPKPIV